MKPLNFARYAAAAARFFWLATSIMLYLACSVMPAKAQDVVLWIPNAGTRKTLPAMFNSKTEFQAALSRLLPPHQEAFGRYDGVLHQSAIAPFLERCPKDTRFLMLGANFPPRLWDSYGTAKGDTGKAASSSEFKLDWSSVPPRYLSGTPNVDPFYFRDCLTALEKFISKSKQKKRFVVVISLLVMDTISAEGAAIHILDISMVGLPEEFMLGSNGLSPQQRSLTNSILSASRQAYLKMINLAETNENVIIVAPAGTKERAGLLLTGDENPEFVEDALVTPNSEQWRKLYPYQLSSNPLLVTVSACKCKTSWSNEDFKWESRPSDESPPCSLLAGSFLGMSDVACEPFPEVKKAADHEPYVEMSAVTHAASLVYRDWNAAPKSSGSETAKRIVRSAVQQVEIQVDGTKQTVRATLGPPLLRP